MSHEYVRDSASASQISARVSKEAVQYIKDKHIPETHAQVVLCLECTHAFTNIDMLNHFDMCSTCEYKMIYMYCLPKNHRKFSPKGFHVTLTFDHVRCRLCKDCKNLIEISYQRIKDLFLTYRITNENAEHKMFCAVNISLEKTILAKLSNIRDQYADYIKKENKENTEEVKKQFLENNECAKNILTCRPLNIHKEVDKNPERENNRQKNEFYSDGRRKRTRLCSCCYGNETIDKKNL